MFCGVSSIVFKLFKKIVSIEKRLEGCEPSCSQCLPLGDGRLSDFNVFFVFFSSSHFLHYYQKNVILKMNRTNK